MTQEDIGVIRLFVVDDHALFREGLNRLLQAQEGFVVAGCAAGAQEALSQLADARPDVVLLDVDLGPERACDFLDAAREQGFSGRVLVVTAGVADAEAVQLIQAGVSGIFHKHNPPAALCDAIRKVAGGENYLEPRYLKPLFQCVDPTALDSRPKLTERELGVLRLILQGMANKEIGDELSISESSVKAVLRSLFQKLGARSRSQLVKIALEEYRDVL